MQTSASLPRDQFNDLLSRLPAGLDLDALALETKAIERQRKIESGSALLRLALARGPGGLSLSQTAAWASMIGFAAKISDPAIKFRLDKSVDFLAAVTERQLAAKCAGPSLHWKDRFLRVSDGTCVSEHGNKRYWRVHAVFDLGRGGFSHLQVTDRKQAEALDRGAAVGGEVRIGDRYFARASRLHGFRQASKNTADFIVRLRWNSFRLQCEGGKSFNLVQHLRSLPPDVEPHEVMVQARQGKREPVLPLRLIILRKPAEAAASTRERLFRDASRKQKNLDPRSLVAAEFIILATSLAAEHYPAAEVLAAYRLRWQIELAFKRLKSLLHIDRLPTRTPQASRSWLYSHLILALLGDDLSQDFLDSSP